MDKHLYTSFSQTTMMIKNISLKVKTAFLDAAAKHNATPSSAHATWPSENVTLTSVLPVGLLTTGTVKMSPARTAVFSGAPKRYGSAPSYVQDCIRSFSWGGKVKVIIE